MNWYSLMMGFAALHAIVGVLCVVTLRRDVPTIEGAHPAVKPLKFAISIALLLASVALVLRATETSEWIKYAISMTLIVTMIIEMTAISYQAIGGRASHFNVGTTRDAAVWRTMAAAIVVAFVALFALAVVATGAALHFHPLVAAAVRVGLWLLLLVSVSGFAMGGRGSHSVGTKGDLRVPHFFALHALQALPLCAAVLLRVPIADRARWIVLGGVVVIWTALAIGTLVLAFVGRALL